MKIVLIAMPWHGLETASLPLGILKACAASAAGRHSVVDYYANIEWADHLLTATCGEVTPEDCGYIADVGVWHSVGEWVFAGTLYDDPCWRAEEFRRYLDERGVDPGKAITMRQHAEPFIARTVRTVLDLEPDLVGFSTTFSQNLASLAVARRLKAARPSLPVVFGGGNCDGPMGGALHRHFPFLDFVVSGEGERAFVALLDALDGHRRLADVPGLVWRDDQGAQRVNPPPGMTPIGEVPRPDYTGWQAAFEGSRIGTLVEPRLTLEAARGCWWGEKHHCTFCGLNGTSMAFRAKPAAQFLDDLRFMVARHHILDVIMVDNIMSNDYFTDLLPRLTELAWDVTIRYEIKANLRSEQLALLAGAGVRHIQPGIESLSSAVLRLMDKGVHATQNVQVLRDAEDYGLTVDWNMLYGFPGETDLDYTPVVTQLPALAHLQPPAGITRILLERFSPYFDRPELGFATRRPAGQYRHVYHLAEDELTDLAYQFETAPSGLRGTAEVRLRDAVRGWAATYPASVLTQREHGRALLVHDTRPAFGGDYLIDDPAALSLLAELRSPRSVAALLDRAEAGPAEAARALGRLRRRGLVFEEGGRAVAVTTTTHPFRPDAVAPTAAAPAAGR